MNIEIQLQIWNELKPHIYDSEITSAADEFMHLLIQYGADANDIKTYALDTDLKAALQGFLGEDGKYEDDDIIDEDDMDDETSGLQ